MALERPRPPQNVLIDLAVRYGAALVGVAAAMGLRLALEAWVGSGLPAFIMFYPVVMATAVLAGFWPGLVATLAAGVTAAYWIFPPIGQLSVASPVDRVAIAIFTAMGLFMSVIAELHRRNRSKAAAYDRETELYANRKELRNSEARFQVMINAMPQLGWMARPDGYIYWYNERWYKYTGTTPEQMAGWGWQSVHHPAELPSVLERWRATIATGNPFEMTFPLRGADGRFRLFLTRVFPLKDESGRVVEWFGTNTDVEELTRAEHALRESEERWRYALEVSELGAWELNLANHSAWRSLRHDQIFGHKELLSEWTYETFLRHVLEEDRAEVERRFRQATAEHQDWSFECRIRRADGPLRWIWAYGKSIADPDGRGARMFGLIADVTARKEAEEKLRRSEALYRGIGETIDYGVWVCDPDGRNTYASRSFLQMVGITQEQCSNFGWGDRLDHDDAAATIAAWQECVRTGGAWDREHRFRGVDGLWHHVLARGVPIKDDRGNIVCWAGINLDITALKQTQEDLRRAKDTAEVAAQAKSAFLANMSHEIRTPLHVIMGLSHLMRRTLGDPEQVERLDQLSAASEHLLALINDVLDLSKIEAERFVLDHDDFRLDALVGRVVRMVEARAQDKGLVLAVVIAPELGCVELNGDALRLAQVLINLCGNAVKFTDRGSVSLRIDSLGQDADRVSLRFTVSDTGIGIAPEDQGRLFQPFTQLDDLPTREIGGTGLGLAISQRLVTLMGGSIQLQSRGGAGSTFSFDVALPRAAAPVQAAEATLGVLRPVALSGRRILFAEDHPLSQEILFEMLEDLGCVADVASDGEEAVACAQAGGYDLILLDMQMPKLDGLGAARAIRQLPRHRHTPIIALTANAFAEDRQRCLDAGMNGHLGKPVTPATLAALLSQWLSLQPNRSDEMPVGDNELMQALAGIPGLKVGSNWLPSPDWLVELCSQLERFVAMHGDSMTQLREHLMAGDRKAAEAIAHSIKGIAGLLGAWRIGSLADEIEQGLRSDAANSEISELTYIFDHELAGMAESIRRLPMNSTYPLCGSP